METVAGRRAHPRIDTSEAQIEKMWIIAGTPDQVVEKLRVVLEETRPSIRALWG